MKCALGSLLALAGALLALAAWALVDGGWVAKAPRSRAQPAGAAVTAPEQLRFIERTSGGASAKDTLPMLIVLHGLGDTPEDFLELFAGVREKARVVALRAPDPWSVGTSWYPIHGKPLEKSRTIRQRADAVAALARSLVSARPTVGKPVVSGFSQGGVLSFALAAYHAASLHAAVPIAGALPDGLSIASKPPSGFTVFAFHGERDRRIPFADGEQAVKRLQTAGYRATMTGFPGVGHGIPQAMRATIMAVLDELLDGARRGAGTK